MMQVMLHSIQPGCYLHGAWLLAAKNLGFEQIIDIGSGDGRIAYCGKHQD